MHNVFSKAHRLPRSSNLTSKPIQINCSGNTSRHLVSLSISSILRLNSCAYSGTRSIFQYAPGASCLGKGFSHTHKKLRLSAPMLLPEFTSDLKVFTLFYQQGLVRAASRQVPQISFFSLFAETELITQHETQRTLDSFDRFYISLREQSTGISSPPSAFNKCTIARRGQCEKAGQLSPVEDITITHTQTETPF